MRQLRFLSHDYLPLVACVGMVLLACACGDDMPAPESTPVATVPNPQTSIADASEQARAGAELSPPKAETQAAVASEPAPESLYFEPEPDGESVSFGFELSEAFRVGGLEFDLEFDRTRFKAGQLVKGEQMENFLCVSNPDLATGVKVGCVAMPDAVAKNSGVLFHLSIDYEGEPPQLGDLHVVGKVIDEFAKTSDVQLKVVSGD